MIALAYHADLNELQDQPALALLLDGPAQSAPFDRLAFWQGLARHCGVRPLVATARDTCSGKMAVLPLAQDGQRLGALANWYSFRVRPILSPGADGAALLGALAQDLARRTGALVLAPLPDEGGEASLIERAFAGAGWLVWREECDTNHMLDVQGRSFAAYLAGRPGPLRSTLKRRAGKVVCTVASTFDPAIWAAYEEIYAHSWKPEEGSPAFLRAFAEAEGAAGRLRLGLARDAASGQPVAAQMWSVEGGTAFIHKLAYRADARALSPGTSLTAALMAHVIDIDRVAHVDFGTGDDPYKADWMESHRPRYRLTMLRPGAPRQWPALARALVRQLRARWRNTRLAQRPAHG